MQGIIARLKQMGKIRTAENYSCTLKSFMQFREDRDILMSEIDSDLMQLYEAYLHGKGTVRNTSWRFRSKGPQKTDDYFGVKPPKKDPIINKKGRALGSRASIFRSIATQFS